MNNREEVTSMAGQLKKMISILWFAQLVVGISIIAVLFFVIPNMKMNSLPPEYEIYFLIGGLLSGAGALFYKRHIGELLRSSRSLSDDEFWNLVKTKMMQGIALAELPVFIAGLPAYMFYGNQQNFLILAAYSLILFFVVKPPTERPR